METFEGLGNTAGPLLGGILYELGGFKLPFITLGMLFMLLGLLACFLVENIESNQFCLPYLFFSYFLIFFFLN